MLTQNLLTTSPVPGLLILSLVWFLSWSVANRRPVARSAPLPGSSAPEVTPILPGGPENRRRWPRRAGNPVPVFLTAAPGKGLVLDRSQGGLGLLLYAEVRPGTLVRVRVQGAPPDTAWVPAEVRWCAPDGTNWRAGCQFVDPLTWDEMRVFG
jgi:hypothetical protein